MPEQSIQSEDMTLKRVFQDFYSVPDYQREYVWGETDAKGQRGDEVEQFLRDIYNEFDSATPQYAPEYFIGTVVVCPKQDGVFELIDGQQRITTTFLTLCAIRDTFLKMESATPDGLPNQIAASDIGWQGTAVYRSRLDLQYPDSQGVLQFYADGESARAPTAGTRSIANLASAYATIGEFMRSLASTGDNRLRAFYGYLINKVKLIRIVTSSVAKALKIFETVNDRGRGLDAMDLLKNLLFMSTPAEQFTDLKMAWKEIVDTIYESREKPLRFLRYFIFSAYDVADLKLQEDGIYDWLLANAYQTLHDRHPLLFAQTLLDAAGAYSAFMRSTNQNGSSEPGLANTKMLGGTATRQHYILMLAGRALSPANFKRLALEVENLMFVYLITDTSTRDYERSIIEGARRLRAVKNEAFDTFCAAYFVPAKQRLARTFANKIGDLRTWDTRAFRIRYLLAKLTQAIDMRAYGDQGAHGDLQHYFGPLNDVEHILPQVPTPQALSEFGDLEDVGATYKLGNLLLVESAINRALGNKAYSLKGPVYSGSQYLLVRCQASRPQIGAADRITKAIATVPSFPKWDAVAINDRQKWLVGLSQDVWGVPRDQV